MIKGFFKFLVARALLACRAARGIAKFDIVGTKNNSVWQDSERGQRITVSHKTLADNAPKVFAMGSCFAVEIRNALRAMNYDVYPKYKEMALDSNLYRVGKLPERDNINHYDSGLIRQEIERSVDGRRYTIDDFWPLFHSNKNSRFPNKPEEIWQDPYRRHIFAVTADHCKRISDEISATIDSGLQQADIVIITLGLIESWINRHNGLHICQGPASPHDQINDNVTQKVLDFDTNKKNLESIIQAIYGIDESKKIIFTVSPVALGQTYTDQDVVVANMQSKCTLRAAVGEVVQQHAHVEYWPSFEFAMVEDVFERDGRHVSPHNVQRIVQGFLTAHF